MPRITPIKDPQPETPAGTTLAQIEAKLGKVPNAFATIAHSPSALDGYLAFSSALGNGRLTPRQRESIALLVSQVNECQYCLFAHTLTARKAGLNREQVLEARAGRSEDPLNNAILAFTREAIEQRGQVSDAELEAAHSAGLDDGLLMEIVANIALMTVTNYSNRLADPAIEFPAVQTKL
jgi:uncharacterized peroxidase-related enzyme